MKRVRWDEQEEQPSQEEPWDSEASKKKIWIRVDATVEVSFRASLASIIATTRALFREDKGRIKQRTGSFDERSWL